MYPGDVHNSSQQAKNYNTIKEVDEVNLEEAMVPLSTERKFSICEQVVYFCSLSAAAYVGVLCRIYLAQLVKWDGVPLFSSLYPQLVGTVIMGFVTSHRALLATSHAFLYQAIATGLCGSITTFSSWNSEAVSTLLQTGQEPPDNGVRVLGWLTTLFLGVGMSAAALTLGRHLATLSPWADSRRQHEQSDENNKSKCKSLGLISIWLILTLLVVLVPYHFGRHDLIYTCLFASIGVYLRWHLSRLNAIFQNFKLGTFLANVSGTWILGGVVLALHCYKEGHLEYNLLVGVANGFCGCLTTVSTFAFELSTLQLWASYLYALVSIALAQIGLILIRGTVQWTSNK